MLGMISNDELKKIITALDELGYEVESISPEIVELEEYKKYTGALLVSIKRKWKTKDYETPAVFTWMSSNTIQSF